MVLCSHHLKRIYEALTKNSMNDSMLSMTTITTISLLMNIKITIIWINPINQLRLDQTDKMRN